MNCRPGDLAIVVRDGSGGMSGVIGRIVEVIEPAVCDAGPGWLVKMQKVETFVILGAAKTYKGDKFRVQDAWLRPVSGLPIDEETRDEVTA